MWERVSMWERVYAEYASESVRNVLGSIKLKVSFAKEAYKRDDILQKRPVILSILLIVCKRERMCMKETVCRREYV